MRMAGYVGCGLTVLTLGIAAACNDSTNSTTPVATSLKITAGTDSQTAVAGTALPTPLSVGVLDQNGNPLFGAPVTWTVIDNAGFVSSTVSSSDANGLATTIWTLGNLAGVDSVQASIGTGVPVTFIATVKAGAFASLNLVSGNTQSVTAGATTQPLVVRAVDQFGNAVSGVPITWTTTGGGTLSAASSTTDASGQAQVTLTTNGTAGAYTVVASSGTATPVTFNGAGT